MASQAGLSHRARVTNGLEELWQVAGKWPGQPFRQVCVSGCQVWSCPPFIYGLSMQWPFKSLVKCPSFCWNPCYKQLFTAPVTNLSSMKPTDTLTDAPLIQQRCKWKFCYWQKSQQKHKAIWYVRKKHIRQVKSLDLLCPLQTFLLHLSLEEEIWVRLTVTRFPRPGHMGHFSGNSIKK